MVAMSKFDLFSCSRLLALLHSMGYFFHTGGAIGISPLQAGLYGLLASFLTMAVGHWIGQCFARISNANGDEKSRKSSLSNQGKLLLDPSFASGSLLGILSLMSLHEVLSS